MTYLDFKELWVDECSVNPDYQGHGIGGKVLEYARECLKEEGIHHMILATERAYPCVKFYEKNGFKQMDTMVVMSNEF